MNIEHPRDSQLHGMPQTGMPAVPQSRIFSGLIFATSNPNKVREYEQITGEPIASVPLTIDEVEVGERHLLKMADGLYREVAESIARTKAERAFRSTGSPVVVESTTLFIDAFDGWPGPLIGDLDSENARGVIVQMHTRVREAKTELGATAMVTLAVWNPEPGQGFQVRHGIAIGSIARQPQGNSGRGWDNIFRPSQFGSDFDSLTYADLAPEHKNMVSMRAQAVHALRVRPFVVER